ncbi:hypothetical protein CTI14_41125 [Methylobacterium radiotolerans]|nr:hypothetical protein CTI14_41125 [Methylobacterium radiotolerans]
MALDAALRGMMAGLDPYSRVATRAELAAPPASVGQVVNQYVDPLDSRVLVVNGLERAEGAARR